MPPLRISLPNGRSLTSDQSDIDEILSAHFGRNVVLTQSAPDDFTVDQYLPDVAGADAAGRRDIVVAQKLGAALFAQIGMQSPVPAGSFFDGFPLSILTTSTLARLAELRPQSRFDERRFRMNLIISTQPSGFIENDWVGGDLSIGEAVRLTVALQDPRCVMTTLAQDDLPHDTDVLRTLVRHNRIQAGNLGQLPCAGVYAVIAVPGTVRVGDPAIFRRAIGSVGQ